MSNEKLKKAATAASALAALVNVTKHASGEVERVTFAGLPLFSRDEAGNPRLLGLFKVRRRRGPRAE